MISPRDSPEGEYNIPQKTIADESTFFVGFGSIDGTTIRAASWDEAMSRAAKYIAEADHPCDIYEEQWISYTVYKLPAGTAIWNKDIVSQFVLDTCESQDATYLEEEA